jgi:hypothetical protein
LAIRMKRDKMTIRCIQTSFYDDEDTAPKRKFFGSMETILSMKRNGPGKGGPWPCVVRGNRCNQCISINQGGIGIQRFGPDSQIDKKADFI